MNKCYIYQVGLIIKREDQILYFVEEAKSKTILHDLTDDLNQMQLMF